MAASGSSSDALRSGRLTPSDPPNRQSYYGSRASPLPWEEPQDGDPPVLGVSTTITSDNPQPRQPKIELGGVTRFLQAQRRQQQQYLSNASPSPPLSNRSETPESKLPLSSRGTPSAVPGRPTPSIHAQPPAADRSTYGRNNGAHYTHAPPEVSPPSSPDLDDSLRRCHDRSSSPDISPVDQEHPLHSAYQTPTGDHSRAASPGADFMASDPTSMRRQGHTPQFQQPHVASPLPPSKNTNNLARKWNPPPSHEEPNSQHARIPSRDQMGHGTWTGTPSNPVSAKEGQQTDSGKRVTSLGDRMRRMAKPGALKSTLKTPRATDGSKGSESTSSAFFNMTRRPPWRGSSGRQVLIEPLSDDPNVSPLNLPLKETKENKAYQKSGRPLGSGQVPAGPADKTALTLQRSPPTCVDPESNHTSKPMIDIGYDAAKAENQFDLMEDWSSSFSGAHGARRSSIATSLPSQAGTQHTARPSTVSGQSVIRRKLPRSQREASGQNTVESKELPNKSSVGTSQEQRTFSSSSGLTERFNRSYAHEQESLFDIYGGSRNVDTEEPEGSVMDRKRPPRREATTGSPSILESDNPVVISMKSSWPPLVFGSSNKSAGPQAGNGASRKVSDGYPGGRDTSDASPHVISLRPPSIYSDVEKALPPAPKELDAADRVELLNARLESIGNRKTNITRSVKHMTEMMPTDNLLNSAEVMAKRDAEKKKVEALQTELAELQLEEHDLGLKLHRAYKRLEKDSEYELTGLWVRRVTE